MGRVLCNSFLPKGKEPQAWRSPVLKELILYKQPTGIRAHLHLYGLHLGTSHSQSGCVTWFSLRTAGTDVVTVCQLLQSRSNWSDKASHTRHHKKDIRTPQLQRLPWQIFNGTCNQHVKRFHPGKHHTNSKRNHIFCPNTLFCHSFWKSLWIQDNV